MGGVAFLSSFGNTTSRNGTRLAQVRRPIHLPGVLGTEVVPCSAQVPWQQTNRQTLPRGCAHHLLQVPPVFVFAKALGDDPKSIWEAVSHEVGHSIGLS